MEVINMEVINKLDILNDYIITDENSYLSVIKPVVLAELPFIDPSLINDKYLTIETNKTMLKYFKDLLNIDESGMRISVINGMHLDDNTSFYYCDCDYCDATMNDDWFYCYHCNKDMCKMCYEETSEEVALKNGSQNYKKREEALNKCRSCKQIEPRNIYNIIQPIHRMCDLCKNKIELSFYSIRETYDTYDICIECYQNRDDARIVVETKSMQLIDINDKSNYYFGHTGFGSMLYWFPIITDKSSCSVFINLNPDDINYKKICLQSCDDHGRNGYFIIKDETYDLQRILYRLKEICDKGTCELENFQKDENGEYKYVTITSELYSYHHTSPIHILMKELNIPVYYG